MLACTAKLADEKQNNLLKDLESKQQPQSQVAIEGKGKVIPNQPASAPTTQEQRYAYNEKMVARSLDKAEKLGMPAETAGRQLDGDARDGFKIKRYQRLWSRQAEVACSIMPIRLLVKPPMAHGGSKPPNGEDVDAMFFKNYGVNPFIDTEDDHLSTFAMDVDTASYTLVRGYLHDGHMPPNDAVRVEEFVNYFKYNYPAPKKDDFAVYSEASPWQFGTDRKNSYLLRLGLKGKADKRREPQASDSDFCD